MKLVGVVRVMGLVIFVRIFGIAGVKVVVIVVVMLIGCLKHGPKTKFLN